MRCANLTDVIFVVRKRPVAADRGVCGYAVSYPLSFDESQLMTNTRIMGWE